MCEHTSVVSLLCWGKWRLSWLLCCWWPCLIKHKPRNSFHIPCNMFSSICVRLPAIKYIFHSVKINCNQNESLLFTMLRTNAKAHVILQVTSLRNIPDPSQPISGLPQVMRDHFLLSSGFYGNWIEKTALSCTLYLVHSFVCSHILKAVYYTWQL